MRRIGWMAAMAVLLSPAGLAGQSGQPARLHRMINQHRERVGCTPLAWHAPSAEIAAARSADMHERRYFDHVTPEGRNVFDDLDVDPEPAGAA
ncbi:MAG: CAP domain-containing protein [Gemmatimonadota bacterium]